MAEDETTFLCGFGRQRRYGTTSHVTAKPSYSSIIHHNVLPDDTLQGLALRYGSSMTDIKRVNRLWSNESIHLKEVLLIPVLTDCTTPKAGCSKDSAVMSNGVAAAFTKESIASQISSPTGASIPKRHSLLNSPENSKVPSSSFVSEGDKSESSVSDFLSRIDQSIKSTTKNIRKLEKESTIEKVLEQSDSGFSASSSAYSFQNISLRTRSPSPTEVRTEGKKTEIPLEKLRQTRDTFYQL